MNGIYVGMFHISVLCLYGLRGMSLVTFRSAVTSCAWKWWTIPIVAVAISIPGSRCSGMPHGHSPTSVVGNHNQTLIRFNSRSKWLSQHFSTSSLSGEEVITDGCLHVLWN